MLNKEKLILPVSIIVGCIILGGFLYGQEVVQQNGISDRLDTQIAVEEEAENDQQKLEDEKKFGKIGCIGLAEDNYWDYMALNGTEDEEAVIWADNYTWGVAESNKQTDIENCMDLYK